MLSIRTYTIRYRLFSHAFVPNVHYVFSPLILRLDINFIGFTVSCVVWICVDSSKCCGSIEYFMQRLRVDSGQLFMS